MVTGKIPVKSVHTFLVSGSARHIAKNKSFVFSSLGGVVVMFPYPLIVAHYLFIWCFFHLIQMSKDGRF